MSKNDRNFDRFQDGPSDPFGGPDGLRWALGGKTRGVRNAQDCSKIEFGDFFFLNFWLQRPNEDTEIENKTKVSGNLGLGTAQLSDLTRRHPLPFGPGGGLPSPLGTTAARPPFFIVRFGARPLGYVDFGDLKCLRCFLEPVGAILEGLEPS